MAYTEWLPYRSTTPGPWGAGPWQYSANAGGSWGGYAGASVAQIVGPLGTQRYRAQFTIPTGLSGSWDFTANGDLWGTSNTWEIKYDGVTVGTGNQYQDVLVTLPVVAGAHEIQIWASAESSPAGQTQLRLASPGYANVVDPSEPPCQCWIQGPTGAIAP